MYLHNFVELLFTDKLSNALFSTVTKTRFINLYPVELINSESFLSERKVYIIKYG